MKLSAIATAFLVGFAAAVPMVTPPTFSDGTMAPLFASNEAESLSDSYIVVMKHDIPEQRIEQHTNWINALAVDANDNSNGVFSSWLHPDTIGIKHVYNMPQLKGYSGKFGKEVLDIIRRSEDVAYVEKDSMVYTSELQRNAPWGLARISHRETLSFGTFNKYQYADNPGEGIKVYVIDTGVNIEHVDLEGRAIWGNTVPVGDEDEDGNGHGSHCAGTIAGAKYGVAKKAHPVAVKVLRSNGSGTMSDVVKGVEWATERHIQEAQQAKKTGAKYKGAVANMSLGGGKSPTLDRFVNAAVEAGIVFAVAAGNDNQDACNYSPAASELAITVGASTLNDDRAYFSNYGECVDVFAPGLNIQSIWRGSKYATNTISGTSMASPHVAGLAAYFLSQAEEGVTPKQIKDKIIELATVGALKGIPADTPNKLIYNDFAPKLRNLRFSEYL